MNVIDYFGWLLMLGVGFFVGLLLVSIATMFSLGLWAMAGILLVVLVLFILWEVIGNHLTFGFLDRLFGIEKTEQDKADERTDRRVSRYAFVAGIVIAFGAAQIWSPSEIMEAF